MGLICSCCNRPVGSGEIATRFPCPNCGQFEIVRCQTCKKISNTYRCPRCGFEGP